MNNTFAEIRRELRLTKWMTAVQMAMTFTILVIL